MFYQLFLSQKVKRSAIINNKHRIHELPHEFPKHFPANIRLLKASWRHLLSSCSDNVLKTSWRRLDQNEYIQDTLIKANIFALVIRLQDVFKTSYQDVLRLQDVFKMSSRRLAKTSSRHLQDVLQRCLEDVLMPSGWTACLGQGFA